MATETSPLLRTSNQESIINFQAEENKGQLGSQEVQDITEVVTTAAQNEDLEEDTPESRRCNFLLLAVCVASIAIPLFLGIALPIFCGDGQCSDNSTAFNQNNGGGDGGGVVL